MSEVKPPPAAVPDQFHVYDTTLRDGAQQEGLNLSVADNVKAWQLTSDGAYVRVQPRNGQPAIRSQQRFIELTRDKVKVAEAAARPSSRFHMTPTAQRSPLEGKVPRATRRKRRNEDG